MSSCLYTEIGYLPCHSFLIYVFSLSHVSSQSHSNTLTLRESRRIETQNTIELAQNLINNEGFSIERALSALGVPEEKRSDYSKRLKEASAGN